MQTTRFLTRGSVALLVVAALFQFASCQDTFGLGTAGLDFTAQDPSAVLSVNQGAGSSVSDDGVVLGSAFAAGSTGGVGLADGTFGVSAGGFAPGGGAGGDAAGSGAFSDFAAAVTGGFDPVNGVAASQGAAAGVGSDFALGLATAASVEAAEEDEDESPEDESPEDESPEDESPEDESPEDESPEDELDCGEAVDDCDECELVDGVVECTLCNDGFYLDDGDCFECPDGCEECDLGDNGVFCTECEDGMGIGLTDVCEDCEDNNCRVCSLGLVEDDLLLVCDICDEGRDPATQNDGDATNDCL